MGRRNGGGNMKRNRVIFFASSLVFIFLSHLKTLMDASYVHFACIMYTCILLTYY